MGVGARPIGYERRYGERPGVPRRRNPLGFTLLELLIVLLLILLILGLVTVTFAPLFSKAKLSATAREMMTSLKQTRHLAVLRGEKQEWTVNLESREFGPEGGKRRVFPASIAVVVITPEGEEMVSGVFKVAFEPQGGWEPAQFLLSDRKKSITIQLDPVAGARISRSGES